MKKMGFFSFFSILALLHFATDACAKSGSYVSQKSYQIAGLEFLPDYQYGDTGWGGTSFPGRYDKNDNCSSYPLSACPKGGVCQSCAFNRNLYRLTSCSDPYLMSGSTCHCPTATPLTCTNDKCEKYCDGSCIKKTCTPTSNQTGCTNGTQKCDDGCCGQTRDCCIPCTHKITSKPDNSSYTTSKCTDGTGTHDIQTGWSCNSEYHQEGASCVKNCTPKANSTNCDYGTEFCSDGCGGQRLCCKTCSVTGCSLCKKGDAYTCIACSKGFRLDNGKCKEDYGDCLSFCSSSCPPGSSYSCLDNCRKACEGMTGR